MVESVLSIPSATANSRSGSASPNHTPPPAIASQEANKRALSIGAFPLPSGSRNV